MISLTRPGLRRAALGAVLALGLPLIAACDNNEGAAERAGETIDNTVSDAARQTGKALQDVGDAIQEQSKDARQSMDNDQPAN